VATLKQKAALAEHALHAPGGEGSDLIGAHGLDGTESDDDGGLASWPVAVPPPLARAAAGALFCCSASLGCAERSGGSQAAALAPGAA
jgi:hypothetical protein